MSTDLRKDGTSPPPPPPGAPAAASAGTASLKVEDDAARGAAPPTGPQLFGKYYLLDRLAVGGMAEIFRARTFGEGGFENQLVIKRILSHLSENDQFVRMFMDEAKVTVLLQHTNIVRIYDFGKIRDNYFIAMEHVDGKDVKLLLRKLAERRKLLPREYAAYIAMEAAKGLDWAHRKTSLDGTPLQIVHRDVSPSNILVSYQGEVKVADFGIVKASNVAETTDAGTLKGKFEYMSPEQAQGLPLDRRSDVFALGIILHEMLTGRRLFKTDSDLKTLEKIKSGDYPRPSSIHPQIPSKLDQICMKALALRPEDRYQDGREMASDLRDFLYPVQPDVTQQSLAAFLAELFEEDIAGERSRLEEGIRLARAMYASADSVDLEPDWQDGQGPRTSVTGTGTQGTVTVVEPPRKAPLLVLGLVALVAVGAAVFFATRAPETRVEKEVVREVVQVPGATTGSVQLKISPAAGSVSVDGKPVGVGIDVLAPELAPGTPHTLVVTAEGYAPHQESVTVAAGERVVMRIALVKNAGPVVAPTPRPVPTPTPAPQVVTPPTPAPVAATTSTVRFSSKPDGADVLVGGRMIGTTPVEWEGPAGEKKTVEFRLEGYDPARMSVTTPEAGGRTTVEKTLQARARATGLLSVNVSGGWAEIWVDGKKVKTSPLFNHTLSEGPHEVTAKNDALGMNETRKVTIKAGETTSIGFRTP